MSFEIMHFRDADKILEKKNMISDVSMTMEYVYDSLVGSLYRGELHQGSTNGRVVSRELISLAEGWREYSGDAELKYRCS